MRLCLLSSCHPPLDKRVFDKQARHLAAAGHEVTHLCPADDPIGERDGVRFVTYPRPRGLVGRVKNLLGLYRLAQKIDADCYHCNEVDSWVVGVALKLTRRCQVVFDVHEHYPSVLAEGRQWPTVVAWPVAAAIRLLFWLLGPVTDRIVLAKRTVASDFPRRTLDKQVLVQNFAPLAAAPATAAEPMDERRDSTPKPVKAIHIGVFGKSRGWPQLLRALHVAQQRDLRVHVLGEINDGSQDEFERTARQFDLQDRIELEDWLPFAQAFQRIVAADIGLVLFQPGIQNHVWALPHKMFDYMLAGRPVIVPDFAIEVAQIVRDSKCGLLVDPADPQQIADALDRLAADADLRRRLGENGRRAVLARYNWEAEAAKMLEMYRELEHERRTRGRLRSDSRQGDSPSVRPRAA